MLQPVTDSLLNIIYYAVNVTHVLVSIPALLYIILYM